jgi:hypothetical protein
LSKVDVKALDLIRLFPSSRIFASEIRNVVPLQNKDLSLFFLKIDAALALVAITEILSSDQIKLQFKLIWKAEL